MKEHIDNISQEVNATHNQENTPHTTFELVEVKTADEAKQVIKILNSPINRPHFANPYQSDSEVMSVDKPSHVIAYKDRDVIGTLTIDDASFPQNDHFLSLMAVRENMQGIGIGRKFLKDSLDWAFTNRNYEGRQRKSLHAAVVIGILGWEKMYKLLTTEGFIDKVTWNNQFEAENSTHDVVRLCIQREEWIKQTK